MSENPVPNVEAKSSTFTQPATNHGASEKERNMEIVQMQGAIHVPIDKIKPDPGKPRKTFDPDALESLAESIKELGDIIDPISVEYVGDGDFYRIISGERRYRAAIIAGIQWLRCIVRKFDHKSRFLVQMIANLQREDLTPLDEAAGIRSLMERYDYSQIQVTRLLNKSKSDVSRILGLGDCRKRHRK